MTELEKQTIGILRSYGDPACYEQIVQAIARGKAQIIEAAAPGVLIRHTREGFYMLAGDPQRMLELLDRIPSTAEDVMLHGVIAPEVIECARDRLRMSTVEPYALYAYYGEMPPEETACEIRPLGEDALDFVYANYAHASREYLLQLLRDGVMIGAYVDGNLAAFIGEHAAGAMGLLHVMPEYRRHHLGYALERADIRRTMLAGNTPFCQVDPANAPSHHLQEKLGLTRAKGMVYWLC